MAIINSLVEGPIDEAAATRIITVAGHTCGVVYGKRGLGYIRTKIQGFNQSARSIRYLALVDFMDTSEPCPGLVVIRWLPYRNANMLFRIVVRELESWLLADRNNIARFLGLSTSRIPERPEIIEDPKRELINLARRSRSKRVVSALVPEAGSRAIVGKLYTSEMIRFINYEWDVHAARNNAPSLDRCLRRLEEVALDE